MTRATLGSMKRKPIPGLGRRIEETLAEAGLNKHSACQALNVAYTTISNWVNEASVPDTVYLGPIASLPPKTVSIQWLLTGKGPRHVSDAPTSRLSAESSPAVAEVVEAYLVSDIAGDVSMEVAQALRKHDFSVLNIEKPTIADVHRAKDYIAVGLMMAQKSLDGAKRR